MGSSVGHSESIQTGLRDIPRSFGAFGYKLIVHFFVVGWT